VRLFGASMTVKVPMPGVTNGGAVYCSGTRIEGGSSSPYRHTGCPPTMTVVPVPIKGTGAMS
jgi:hypothetical protein